MEKDEQIQVLEDLIKINSVNGNEIEVANYLKQLFNDHGLDAKIDAFGDRRANLIVEFGEGDQVFGVTGHMDTVAVGDEAKWSHSPFNPTRNGDRLYGRGAADMKSGLAAEVVALIELHDAGQLPKGHVRFIATAGEEYGTPGANRLEAAGVADDLIGLLVGEPTSGNVVYAHSGSLNYRIISTGKAVHSSQPENGVNAIDALVDYCVKERHLFDDAPTDPYLGKVKHSVTVVSGGDQVNTIPDSAWLKGNIRPTKSFNNDHVISKIEQAVREVNAKGQGQLTFELIHNFRPVASDPHSKFVERALRATQKAYHSLPAHHQPTLKTINGATDASVFVKCNPDLPVIVLGADDWRIAHQINEYTTISSYLATIQTYREIIEHFFD
ncbi:ArgE/DapE family deacylase [uncultured Limosilactobacillus sp.]|uniref:ArgE/DapE family deacylase n=1 Tax=uncultured Limosilactobacillus sp. TaxID=2837629 RepID=UPI0025E6FFA5|nr:ArgE/DapE family deacylase [uncultured Limosilactobacillus sp.]